MAKRSVNSREIDRLRKKKTTVQRVLWGCLALMPASLIGGCGLAIVIPHDTLRAVFGMVAVLGPFVGLAGILLMWNDRGRYDRALDLARQGDRLGLAYSEQATEAEHEQVAAFQVFNEHTSDYAVNQLTGQIDDTQVLVMDYNCAWGGGASANVIRQTVIILHDAVSNVPELILYPKTLLQKLAETVGLGDNAVKISGADKFNRTYGLYSKQRNKSAALFAAKLVAFCLKEKDLVVEVMGGNLLVYWAETNIMPEQLKDRLATAVELAQLLQETT